ncbi:MAG: EutN/CcmL family microcompartment protein [Chloroflexi bacterium]|nr:EutN/CcmL family microcompartment protein [Chloroflexota bacterium]
MQLGRVMGTVVATRRTNSAEGWTFRVVGFVNQHNQLTGQYAIAVDAVGAADGEIVLLTSGSAARQNALTAARPCDAIIMAIVDTWAVHDEVRYTKYA